jgi:hypothetical protein
MDKEDQMIEIYRQVIIWADVLAIATPIRWGSASSLYYQMIQRMNCVQNQIITHDTYLIRDKVAASSFIIAPIPIFFLQNYHSRRLHIQIRPQGCLGKQVYPLLLAKMMMTMTYKILNLYLFSY